MYLVVPCFGVVAVLATARLASQLATPRAGAVAALCLASSPTFLFSLMWPMSDVPAAALWVLTLVLVTGAGAASAALAGAATALAVLTRPNLVLVALAPSRGMLRVSTRISWAANSSRQDSRKMLPRALSRALARQAQPRHHRTLTLWNPS